MTKKTLSQLNKRIRSQSTFAYATRRLNALNADLYIKRYPIKIKQVFLPAHIAPTKPQKTHRNSSN